MCLFHMRLIYGSLPISVVFFFCLVTHTSCKHIRSWKPIKCVFLVFLCGSFNLNFSIRIIYELVVCDRVGYMTDFEIYRRWVHCSRQNYTTSSVPVLINQSQMGRRGGGSEINTRAVVFDWKSYTSVSLSASGAQLCSNLDVWAPLVPQDV